MILSNRQEQGRFLRFAIVGAFGAIIDFAVMNFLSHYFSFNLVLAGSISFICAIISNFIWNRYWTYPDSRSRNIYRQLAMFFMVNLAGVMIRIPILHFLEPLGLQFLQNRINISSISNSFIAKNGTLSLAIIIVMLWNYFVNRYWTYNDIDS